MAYLSFISHLEQDQERTNPAFILKNLLILDFTVQQRVLLTKISQYQNKRLVPENNSLQISSTIKNLIASYFVYVKEKAKIYISELELQLTNRKLREPFLQKLQSSQLKNQINNCLKLQNLILEISDKYLHGNKNVQIIQYIFASLLRCYLFCYSVVAIIIKIFLSRSQNMNREELEHLYKLGNYFNKDYTRNFLLFIERNKSIEAFKNIKYDQFVNIDVRILQKIKNQIIRKKSVANWYRIPQNPMEIPFKLQDELLIQTEKLEQISQLLSSNRRKTLKLSKKVSLGENNAFDEYQNFYSENFIIQDETIDNALGNGKKLSSPFRLKHKLTLYQDASEPDLKSEYLMSDSGNFDSRNQFNKQIWNNWNNIYADS